MRYPSVLASLAALVVTLAVAAPPARPAAAATGSAPAAELVPLEVAWASDAPGARAADAGGSTGPGAVGAASTGASGALRPSAPIDLAPGTMIVGADWGGDADVVVEVRSRHDGRWEDWLPVDLGEEEGPDQDSEEASSTWSVPVLVGNAEAVQFRTDADDLDAMGVVVDHEAAPVASASSPDGALSTASAMPNIISREQWGADESRRDPRVPSYSPTVRFGVVHHTAGSNNYSKSESAGIVRGIYEYHTGARGWWDIGYNFLVDKYGQVFEGRYGGVDRAVNGAHASGFNQGSVGVAVLGDYRGTPLTSAGRAGLEGLLAWKFTHHHVDPQAMTTEVAGSGSRFEEGKSVRIDRIVGHRHLGYTECPGSIYDLIDRGAIAAGVRARMGPTIATDSPDALASPLVGPPTEFDATTTRRADWTLRVRDAAGRTVRTRTWRGSQTITASWDHQTDRGNWVRPGEYDLVLSATLDNGRRTPAITIPVRLGLNVPIVGDWDGDGSDEPGWWREGRWFMHDGSGGVKDFAYGRGNDVPVVGDWDGDGRDDIGIVRGREWHLRLTHDSGPADETFIYGRSNDLPIIGDWDADGRDEIGIVRDREWHLRYELAGGGSDHLFVYGRMTAGDIPLVGDWNENGQDSAGVVRGDTWYLKEQQTSGPADLTFIYGRVGGGDIPVVGDWNGDGGPGIGVIRGPMWYLREELSGGSATSSWEVPVP